ncbi:MAG TPA: ThuA domain-containing protein [Kofleriaceae bacterium]
MSCRLGLGLLVLLLLLVACSDDPVTPMQDDRVLVFTLATGVRHDEALDAAKTALPARLAMEMVTPDFTEDPAMFTDDNLERYRAVIFLYTSGDNLLDDAGKLALERFVRHGGGWLGVHSAAETETMWPFYKTMVAAYSAGVATPQPATVTLALAGHAALRNVPAEPWVASDEWYNFMTSPRSVLGVDVLAVVDETTYTGGTMGTDHPIIWVQERLIGRTFYTALGHGAERWQEPAFIEHIASGVRWVTGLAL